MIDSAGELRAAGNFSGPVGPVVLGRADAKADGMIRRTVRFLDERSGAAPSLRKSLRYAFPDHWSFLLGEVALYAFIVLVVTGHLPDLLLRAQHRRRPSTTAATGRCGDWR